MSLAVYDIEIDGPHNFVAEGVIVHNSEVVYHRNRDDLAALGVLFCDMDTALREYPELVKEYFGTIIPANDNKFAALNSAVWSGGSLYLCAAGGPCRSAACRPTSGSTPRTWGNSSAR